MPSRCCGGWRIGYGSGEAWQAAKGSHGDLIQAGILLWLFIFATIGTWVIWRRGTAWKVIGLVCVVVAVVPVAIILWATFLGN